MEAKEVEKIVLQMNHISKKNGTKRMLQDFSLSLNEGKIYGLIGENGSGKSMVFRIILGLETADTGDIFICGEKAERRNRNIYRYIGYVPDFFGMYHNLKVSEYMTLFAQTAGMSGLLARKKIGEVLGKTRLYGYENEYIEVLSASIRQRLCIAASLLRSPKLLLLDGPTKGVDPQNRAVLQELFLELASEGVTILIASQDLEELTGICTDFGIMAEGQIKSHMTLVELEKETTQNAPIKIVVDLAASNAVFALRGEPMIKSISTKGNTLRLIVDNEPGVEKRILRRLVEEEITVLSFTRDFVDKKDYLMERMKKEKMGI